MWNVYVIRSLKDGFIYYGMSENVSNRLKAHNRGKVRSTKAHRPFELVYSEPVGDRQVAREREKYFKSGAGRRFIKRLLKSNGGSPPA
ncbi:MAG: GIY-YIG nuclease family protein [Fidelibacterota bacterium]